MNLNQLRYFISVAESGSFTKAAMNHYVSQTAVTQQIHSLEEHIGTKLLDRNSRPVSLTPAGKVFHSTTPEVFEKMVIGSRIDEDAFYEMILDIFYKEVAE